MAIEVSFEPICAAGQLEAEDACLVYANQQLVALLLPAETGWFLHIGLGPCEREGLTFETLTDAATWVRTCFSAARSAA